MTVLRELPGSVTEPVKARQRDARDGRTRVFDRVIGMKRGIGIVVVPADVSEKLYIAAWVGEHARARSYSGPWERYAMRSSAFTKTEALIVMATPSICDSSNGWHRRPQNSNAVMQRMVYASIHPASSPLSTLRLRRQRWPDLRR